MRGSLTVSYNTLVVAGQFVATLTCGAFASVHEASRDIASLLLVSLQPSHWLTQSG